MLEWFESFLRGRFQSVSIDGDLSNEIIIEFGVPQGSVLGPVLFNIYMRSLFPHVTASGFSIQGYADDCQVYRGFKLDFQFETLKTCLPACFALISSWMRVSFLKLNPDKSEIIVFIPEKQQSDLSILLVSLDDANTLTIKRSVKLLGFHLDSSLNCDRQVSDILQQSYSIIRNIAKIRSLLTVPRLKIVVNALILSRIDYCNSLLFQMSAYNIRRLQLLQNSAARLIFGKRKYDHVSSLLQELHWLKVKPRIYFKVLFMVFKCINSLAPDYLSELISVKNPITMILYIPPVSSMTGDKAFSVCGPRLWNGLPRHIRIASSTLVFKSKLKHHLFNRFEEYILSVNRFRD